MISPHHRYEFRWLTRTPVRAEFHERTRTLRFPGLLPAISKEIAAQMTAIIAARGIRGVPAHKRLDARRARVSSASRKSAFSLSVEVRGRNHDYAVKTALNLINQGPEIFSGQRVVLWKLLLTYFVPFAVAIYGSYAALRSG